MVGQKELSDGKIHLIPLATPPERLQALTQTMIMYIDTRPVAEETIRRLGPELSPGQLLNNLTIEQMETSQLILLSYKDTDPQRAEQIVNAVGQVSTERISASIVFASNIEANVIERATVPDAPASPKPLRNGLIALVAGLALSAALIEARRRARINEGREQ
jgi:capsular polysaccharide biosynthesis protein